MLGEDTFPRITDLGSVTVKIRRWYNYTVNVSQFSETNKKLTTVNVLI